MIVFILSYFTLIKKEVIEMKNQLLVFAGLVLLLNACKKKVEEMPVMSEPPAMTQPAEPVAAEPMATTENKMQNAEAAKMKEPAKK